jgi:hypothetical protein
MALPQLQRWWQVWSKSNEPTTLGNLSSSKAVNMQLPLGVVSADKETLQIFLRAFTEVNLNWLHTYDFGGSFLWSEIERLRKYVWDTDRVEHEFIDKELERLRTNLTEAIMRFSHLVGLYTTTISRHEDDQVKKIPDQYDEDGNYSDTRFFKKSGEINEAAEAVFDAYTNLVRRARIKLNSQDPGA